MTGGDDPIGPIKPTTPNGDESKVFQGIPVAPGTNAGRRGSFPLALTGMFALIALVEAVVGRYPVAFSDYMACSWRFAAEAARGTGARAEVLGLGDSMLKLGVQPPVLERRLGRPSYNLAIYGGQAPSTYFLLRRVIESGGRPKVVIVNFHSNLLSASPTLSAPYWNELISARDGLELAYGTRSPNLVTRTALARLLPTFNGREEIRAAILASAGVKDNEELEARRSHQRNWQANHGGHANDSAYHAGESIDVNPARPGKWSPRTLHVGYVRRFLDLAQSRGIMVVWLIPPTHADWQLRRERLRVDELYTRFIRQMTTARPNVMVVDGRHAGYPQEAMVDSTHLGARGGTEVTEALADILAPRLAGVTGLPNWVDLPRYRGMNTDPCVETLGRSRQTLRLACERESGVSPIFSDKK